MEPVLFFGGGALTALIALGILPWGALGIGICATLTFIGISRFVLTNSWTWWHNRWTEGKKENDEENLDKGNYTQTNEQEEKGDEEKYGTGFVKSDINLLKMVKYRVSPIILAVAGIVFGVLGATGVLGPNNFGRCRDCVWSFGSDWCFGFRFSSWHCNTKFDFCCNYS